MCGGALAAGARAAGAHAAGPSISGGDPWGPLGRQTAVTRWRTLDESHVLSGLCPYTHPLALGGKTSGHMVSPVLAQIRKMKLGEVIISWYSTWDFKLR